MKKLIAGNWKMNPDGQGADELIRNIIAALDEDVLKKADFLVCPPFIHIDRILDVLKNEPVDVGGQDCSDQNNGAYTGQTSASMLCDIGCSYVILGHSERRQYNGETNELVRRKAEKALAHYLTPIICVGENLEERENNQEYDVVGRQLVNSIPALTSGQDIVIAYEPVWAIGTGKAATPEDIKAMHGFIREKLKEKLADSGKVRILYGGSVKPDNAGALFALENVDGALIGGASLDAEQFTAIAEAV